MELVTILRELAARRWLVVACAVLALLIGLLTAFKVSLSPPGLQGRQYPIGVATTRILVDTSASQIYDLGELDTGAGTLEGRATLLANVMGSEQVEQLISQRLGIAAAKLTVLLPTATAAPVATPLAEQAKKASKIAGAYVLTVQSDTDVSVIYVDAEAPNAAAAAKLAEVSVTSLRDYVNQLGAKSDIPANRRVVVSRASAVEARDVQRGTGPLMGVIVAFGVFFVGVTAIVIGSGLVRAWRQGPMPRTAAVPVRRPLPPGVRPQRAPGAPGGRPAPLGPGRAPAGPGRAPAPRRLPDGTTQALPRPIGPRLAPEPREPAGPEANGNGVAQRDAGASV